MHAFSLPCSESAFEGKVQERHKRRHDSVGLFDNDTEPLLTPGFWILPLYRELLNSARRNRPSAASERARGCTGLVKLICKENKAQRGKRKFHEGEPHPNDRGGFTQWFGSCSVINTLYVWFPASWAPMVAERLFGWSISVEASYSRHGQPASGPPQKKSGAHPLASISARGCWFWWGHGYCGDGYCRGSFLLLTGRLYFSVCMGFVHAWFRILLQLASWLDV